MAENITGNSAPASSPAALVHKTRLSPSAKELLQDQSNGRPVWIRSPKQGVEFYTGFSRARLYQGAADGEFRSVSIRKPGMVKGTRLFHLQSLLDFIAKGEQDAADEAATQKGAVQNA
jgi:hypothetical protein